MKCNTVKHSSSLSFGEGRGEVKKMVNLKVYNLIVKNGTRPLSDDTKP